MWIIALVITILAIFAGVNWLRQTKIKRWRKALALDKHYAAYHQLYANVDGFVISKAARVKQDAMEYVYGEIDFEPFIALLSLCNPNSSTVFYDLGSGTGKAVLACSMVFNVKKSCGIELFPSLHQCAELQQQRLAQLPDYRIQAEHIQFKLGNILEEPLRDASLIFINATAFFGETWLAISKHVEQIKPGAFVISTSKALHSNLFKTTAVTQVRMSWGIVNAFIQQRRLPEKRISN